MSTAVLIRRPPPFFSLGVLLRRCWRTQYALAPFGLAAGALAALSLWDWIARSGRVDFVLLGLAGYELILGLTE
jgi:hypothetical protein